MMRGTERLSAIQIAQVRSEIPRLNPDRTFMFTTAHREPLKNLRLADRVPHYSPFFRAGVVRSPLSSISSGHSARFMQNSHDAVEIAMTP
jgi:hypothetical protein